ncbi:hypothetical protein MD484_g3658, partial [Candolleomyces efflorescens]
MKRVAEKQLIKDDADLDGEDGDDVGNGFKKADESVLATRKIRGLPKRSQASAAAPSAPAMSWGITAAASSPADPAPASKFAGFSGFGSAAAPKPFTFSTSPATSASPPVVSSLFGGPTLAAAPSTSAAASNTAKTFASFIGATSNGVEAKATPSSSEEDKPAVDYYSSLRGLNVSLLKALNKNIEEDPFFDVSPLLELYKTHRASVQKEFDSKKNLTSKATSNAAPVLAPPKSFTMPIPPSSTTSGFKLPTPSSSSDSSAPLAGGFVLKPTTTSSTSLFTLPASSETSSSPSLFSLGGAKPSITPSAFGFGAPAKDVTSTSASPFTFGAPAKEATSSSSTSGGFTFGVAPKDTSSSTSSAGFSFGGPAKDTNSTGFTFGAPAKDTSSTTASPFTFGAPPKATPSPSLPFSLTPSSSASTPPKSVFGDAAKTEDKEKPAVATASNPFGMSTSTSSPFGTFGKPASSSASGSLGNPVGFGFGAAASGGGGDSKPGFSFGSSSGGFSFAPPAQTTSTSEKGKEELDEGAKKADASVENGGANAVAAVLGANPHDEEGEGEEEEETIHGIKSKAYRMKKAEEKGGVGWVEIGYGILRLKKHKETDARRMLLRNSTTGKININFKLYSGLKPSQTKKAVTFVGHDNGVAQTYSIRVGTEEQAKELKEAIDREIAAIKAKE